MLHSMDSLTRLLNDIDWNIISTLKASDIDTAKLEQLRLEVLSQYKELGQTSTVRSQNIADVIATHNLKHRDGFVAEDIQRIHLLATSLCNAFPNTAYRISHRICSTDACKSKFALNGERALLDIVGFQIVPKTAQSIVPLLRHLDGGIAGWEEVLRFNTFLLHPDDFQYYIGPHSCAYYRALHVYLASADLCAEVQIRLPATHEWSKLHHRTLYKPRLDVSPDLKKQIISLGANANYIDYSALLA